MQPEQPKLQSFFGNHKTENNINQDKDQLRINGLNLVYNLISKEQEQQLVKNIKSQQWNTSLKRRTQHYGYEYSYDRKSIATKTQSIPEWCMQVKVKIQKFVNSQIELIKNDERQNLQEKTRRKMVIFDQMIVNQYEPGQGINPHIDNIELFQETVVSLSLASDTIMIFERNFPTLSKQQKSLEKYINKQKETFLKQSEVSKIEFHLKRRSIIVLKDDARYKWKHSIPSRKKDNGVNRSTRYSITFRSMKL